MFNSVNLAARFVAEGACIALISEYIVLRSSESSRLGVAYLEGLNEVTWGSELVYSKIRGVSFAGWEMVKRIIQEAEEFMVQLRGN